MNINAEIKLQDIVKYIQNNKCVYISTIL